MGIVKTAFSLDYLKGANRIDLYDFLRGVAMVIVMIQHAGVPGYKYLLTFHMPLFFFLSGMVVGGRELPSFKKYVWNKFKRLMIPYFVFGILTIFINWIYLSFWGDDFNILQATIGVVTGQYGFVPPVYSGLYWFLFVMFMADIMVYPINKYLRNSMAAKVGGALFLLILSYLTVHVYPIPLFTIEKSFMGAAFILLGELCKPITKYLNESKFNWVEVVIFLFALFGVWLSERMNSEKVLFYMNQYGNYGWYFLGAASGITSVILISKNIYLLWSKKKLWFYNLFMWVGFNSLVIFPVHLMINQYLGGFVSFGPGSCILRFVLMFVVGIPLCNFITNYMPWMLGVSKKK